MQTIKSNFFCIAAAMLLSLLSGPGLAQNVTPLAAAESKRAATKAPSALHSLQEATAGVLKIPPVKRLPKIA